MALRDVMNLAKTLQLNLKPSGTGYVTEQSVAEGTLLQPGTGCHTRTATEHTARSRKAVMVKENKF